MDLLNDSIENWIYLGKSPVSKVRVPNVRFNLKFKFKNQINENIDGNLMIQNPFFSDTISINGVPARFKSTKLCVAPSIESAP